MNRRAKVAPTRRRDSGPWKHMAAGITRNGDWTDVSMYVVTDHGRYGQRISVETERLSNPGTYRRILDGLVRDIGLRVDPIIEED